MSEPIQAAEHLGIEVYFLGYPDGELANTPPELLLESIACWFDLVQPQVDYPEWFETQREENAEITEAIMVARYIKQATVNDTASNTLRLLSSDQ